MISGSQELTVNWSLEDIEKIMASLLAGLDDDTEGGRKGRRILDVATQSFIQHGYRKTSVDDVARRAGVAKGTVYLYFSNKADLLVAALTREKRDFMRRLAPLFEDGVEPRERLRLWLSSFVELPGDMPLTARMLGGDREIGIVLDEIDDDLLEQTETMKIGFLAALIGDALKPDVLAEGELRDRARALIATFQSAGFFVDDKLRAGLPRGRFAELLSTLLLDGVLAGSGHASSAGNVTEEPVGSLEPERLVRTTSE